MRIGFISLENPYNRKNNGGIGTYTGVVAEGLASLGHQVHVITIGENWEKEMHIKNNLLLHEINPDVQTRYYTYLEYLIRIFYKVRHVKENFGLDLVEAPEWLAQGFMAAAEGLLPVVTRLHTPLFLVEDIGMGHKMYKEQEEIKRLEKLQALKSIAVTSPSLSLKNIVEDRWGISSSVLPNPISVEKLEEACESDGHFGNPEEEYILYIGRLEYRKGVLTLAESLNQWLGEFPRLKVVFCGQNTFYKKQSVKAMLLGLSAEYKNRICFIEHAEGSEKHRLIRNARAVVLPSLWENFSYVALEAMAIGSTVVAAGVGGFVEMIRPGIDGYLLPPDDPGALSRLLSELMHRRLPSTGASAAERVRESFDIKGLANVFSDYYNSLV